MQVICVLSQVGPGLSAAVHDSEKALQEATVASESMQHLRANADKSYTKVMSGWG